MKQFFTVLFFFIAQLAVGQDPYYFVVDKTKGLPSNSVYDIYQDKNGFMWFATDDGLCRYDGAKFDVFYSDRQTSRAGSKIAQDKFGRIWYSNFDGYLYFVENGKLYRLDQEKPIGFHGYAIIGDFLFVLKKGGVCKYNLKTLNVVADISVTDKHVIAAAQMDNSFYVLAEDLFVINVDGAVKRIKLPNDFYTSLKHAIMLKATPRGLLMVSKITNQYYIYSDGNFLKKQKIDQPDYVHNLTFVDHRIWLFSPKGAHMFSADHKQSSNYFKQFNVSSAYKDDRNNYWFSTLNRGVILVPNFDNSLIEMGSRPIRLALDRDKLIVSTENESLYEMDTKKYEKRIVYKGNSNHSINHLFVDTVSGNLMFSSNTFNILSKPKAVLAKAHVAVKEIEKIDDKYYSFAASGFLGLFKNSSSRKSEWDSLYNSYKVNKYNFEEITLKSDVNGKSTAYNPKNKTLYYATNIGLFFLDKHGYAELKLINETLFIKNLVTYHDKVYALSTNGKLYEIDSNNTISVSNFSKQHPAKDLYRISKSNTLLFICTATGIYSYDISTGKFTQLPNSYKDFEVTDIVDCGDKFILATSKGILIEPKKTIEKVIAPVFKITNLTVNDVAVAHEQLPNLAYYENNIAISYALLAYTFRERFPIYYKLNDDKWQLLQEQSGSLKLSSLSSGYYQILFRVGSTEHYTKLSFEIKKPFWLTFWFLFFVFLIAAIIIYLFYRYKIKQHQKQSQQKVDRISMENNLNQSKLKAIKSQMNPHFFYNALNTIQSYILSNEKKQAVNYLSKFANLTRTILEMSEKDEVSLIEEIKTIGFYLDIEKARFNGDFEYTITELGINAGDEIRIPSLLLQPYLENAVKHGLLHKEGNKILKVIFKREPDKLIVTIDDNGIGRKKSMALNEIKQLKHKSFATAAMQSRIDLLNKNKHRKISVNYIDKIGLNQQGVGTVVTIELPLT